MGGETDRTRWRGVRPVDGISGVWPALNTTRVNKGAGKYETGTTIIYTVPTGKILFIASAFMGSRLSANGLKYATFDVSNAGDVLQYYMYQHQYDIAGQQANGMSFIPALEAEADWKIRLRVVGTNIEAIAIFHGWLEDA